MIASFTFLNIKIRQFHLDLIYIQFLDSTEIWWVKIPGKPVLKHPGDLLRVDALTLIRAVFSLSALWFTIFYLVVFMKSVRKCVLNV